MRAGMTFMVLLVLFSSMPMARAGDIAFGALQPDGVLYKRSMQSMQERRFNALVRQQTDFSCGAAALATILRYGYHVQVDEATVIEGMMGVADPDIVSQRGFSLLDNRCPAMWKPLRRLRVKWRGSKSTAVSGTAASTARATDRRFQASKARRGANPHPLTNQILSSPAVIMRAL